MFRGKTSKTAISGYGPNGLQTNLRLSLIDPRRLFILSRQVNCGCGPEQKPGDIMFPCRSGTSGDLFDTTFGHSSYRKDLHLAVVGLAAVALEGQKSSDIMLHTVIGLAAIFSIRRLAIRRIEKIST